MSTLTIRRLQPGWLSTALQALENTIAGIIEGHEIAARYRTLSRLSDAELAQLGLSREQVPQAAVRGVAGL
jgi:hypothetical protein